MSAESGPLPKALQDAELAEKHWRTGGIPIGTALALRFPALSTRQALIHIPTSSSTSRGPDDLSYSAAENSSNPSGTSLGFPPFITSRATSMLRNTVSAS